LPLIRGDRIQLQQIVLNLIMNAVEAMSDASGGSRDLLISTAEDTSNGVLVAVRDSGPGLSPESLERLFDPFYTTKPGGMGTGQSICRRDRVGDLTPCKASSPPMRLHACHSQAGQ
jgi:C4-dicarboxylate-specific signal transduction histidine kinase